ncbi:winged helix-turn-helix transcriptional regulator [Pseudomonas frederiksbergensis]|uniref:winged helix-turn-helix transcriptional regulator n=1 Tax=Pseudomonas frederiksbergensis TaxID=104087 RepID=UPI00223B8E04|nr:winged helix-turn-helix transcriptional regulator [Pseudomonas frederiksbergensis]
MSLIKRNAQINANLRVSAQAYPEVHPRVEYALTTQGHALGPAMTAISTGLSFVTCTRR